MNINFHYFAMKVLARTAGFDEVDAQVISEYSQFVDDFHPFLDKPMNCYSAPKRAQFLCKDLYDRELKMYVKKFIPVNTGFAGIEYVFLTSKYIQENTLIPFHFIPREQLDQISNHGENGVDRRDYCVKRFDNTPSLLKSLLNYISYLHQLNSMNNMSLIRLGIILHIFSDSYSHQKFSGYWGWENSSRITRVVDNITNEDVTSKYPGKITENLPSIGHSNSSTVPDESNVSFTINFKSNRADTSYEVVYTRNNTTEFLLAARNILNYLRRCKEKEPISDCDWLPLEQKLRQGFLTTYKRVKSLTDHWSKIFNDIEFYYNEAKLNEPSDNYFDFNICAYEIREIILGKTNFPYGTPYADFLNSNIEDLLL
ncbi:DUF6765 family protein [Clostridium sp.]|uniref:DUF6765 family protein n=1 Tax=Clostridium sp. TaxID=1506 RepID=UPI0028493487|nr:DUF6765 family protein [Clostridium sp.]MDR3595452.1 hypothetical protein [Clostridium sp.]